MEKLGPWCLCQHENPMACWKASDLVFVAIIGDENHRKSPMKSRERFMVLVVYCFMIWTLLNYVSFSCVRACVRAFRMQCDAMQCNGSGSR